MAECNKIVDVTSLETCSNIDNENYIIVQGTDSVCRAKISDLVLGPDNVDFYPELIEILNKLNSIITNISPLSAGWQQTKETVDTNKPLWDRYNSSTLGSLENDITDNIDRWNDATGIVEGKYQDWDNTTQTVAASAGPWNTTYDILQNNQQKWDNAAVATSNGQLAIFEALEMMETSPWFTLYTDGKEAAPPIASLWSLYTTVQDNSASW